MTASRAGDRLLKLPLGRRSVLGLGSLGLMTLSGALARAAPGARRLLHIDSYHQGNEWNDRIAAAVVETLAGTGVEVRIFHMDSKRRPSAAEIEASVAEALAVIEDYRPDVVTVSDDNAVEYLLMPHFQDAELPFVFCGLNWDAGVYGLPYRNATGMVEVSPIPQLVTLLEAYTDDRRLGYLAEDTPTKHKEKAYHEKLFGLVYEKAYFVSTFAEWQEAFLRAQEEVGILLLLGVGALGDWDDAEARAMAERATAIPTGTDFAWLMPYALLGIGKLPEEQGRWVANAALKIMDGVPPSSIPVTHNTQGELLFNPRIARQLGIGASPPLAQLVE